MSPPPSSPKSGILVFQAVLFFLAKNQGLTNGPEWQIDTQNTVGLPGAHGDELVRSFCFFDDAELVFTAGEDGTVKAWRPTS
ncbi:hypothetical protein E4U15_006318 [Claviceps sp. LM218 group G6]|nr:hypothetical protein E4U15_006318 [Claviceps sp. LM218 group G6]